MTVLEYLESFNRKERFFLIGEALGNPAFQLSSNFRAKLSAAFGIQPPRSAFVAMDYHLDWIHASLFLTQPGIDLEAVHSNKQAVASGNQEDIDLLIAFEEGDTTHILLLEAKAASGWTNKQMLSKAERLKGIFGADGTKYPNVKPRFGLTSPRRPTKRLKSLLWPAWMTLDGQPIWFELKLPTGRRKVTRCDCRGKSDAEGGFFRAEKSKF
jgi:hypothetical protein